MNGTDTATGSISGTRQAAPFPAGLEPCITDFTREDHDASTGPALHALADSLRVSIGCAATAIAVFDVQNRWITAVAGPAWLLDPSGLVTALGGGGGQSEAATISAHVAGPQPAAALLLDGAVPQRLDGRRLCASDGRVVGVICVLDHAPGRLDDADEAMLRLTGDAVLRLLALHDRLENLRHVILLSPLMGCSASADGTIIEMAEPLRAALGLAAAGDLTTQYKDHIHPDDLPIATQTWTDALREGMPMETIYRLSTATRGHRWFRVHAKPRLDATGEVIRWCGLLEDVHESRSDKMRLAHLAYHDPLTGLSNRAHFRLLLDRQLGGERSPRFALARLELLDFRALNGTFGHAFGDRLLREAACRIGLCTRDGDLLAHGGGNEFFLLLPALDRPSEVAPLMQRILDGLRAPMQIEGSAMTVGAAIGVTLCPADGTNADILLQNADLALLRARIAARGGHRFFSPDMDETIRRSQALKVDLAHALERDQFFLVYQPILDASTGRVRALEALLRWRHPERGLVSPADFIPEAEASGLIVPIGRWVIRQACRDAVGWPSHVGLGVNLSAAQFGGQELVQTVAEALRTSGLQPSRLVLEITESLPLLEEEGNLAVLRGLRELGAWIALDDFGTGYASLSYLQCFSFDIIKLERSFVARILDSEPARVILRAVIRLSEALGSMTVAEGVETEQQRDALREEGCNAFQGFLFSRPVEAAAVPGVVAALGELGACDHRHLRPKR